ncbi:MAG: enoyl-CoA hydratase [Pseudolabrys sp.]|nr:enoyl-CoA hydratase [Pseudolabrys sp.]
MTAHSTASDAAVLRGDIDGIALLSLNRPSSRNALSEAMLGALETEFAQIAADKGVRAIILTHNGRAFSAGHDMKEMTAHRSDADRGRAYFKALMQRCSAMMLSIRNLPQPVIAAVEGVASAAGCQLVASCDLAIASQTARFATPGVNIGLFCSTPMVAISRSIGTKHMMEMLLSGELVSADDAYRFGLVNRVVPPGQASEQALEFARRIAAKSMPVVKIGKQAFYQQRELSLEDAYKYTVDVMVENMLFGDAEEGIGAFIDKRDPKWEDR